MSTTEYQAEVGPNLPGLRAAIAARRIPAEVWIVAGITVLAAAVRFVTISSQSYWADEALTAYEAHLPLGAMINTVAHVETTPPLYFVLIWAWAKVFGTGEAALRSLSALAGIAIVPIAYLSARELISRRAGVIAAAFAASSPFLIWYSQEARAYMLLATLSAASFLWFIRARSDPSRKNLWWWVVCSALALMTHFFAGFLVAPEALWLLWVSRTRAVAVAVGAVAAVQLAMLPFALIDAGHGAGWIATVNRSFRVGQVPTEFTINTMYRGLSTVQELIGAAIVTAGVLLALVFGGDSRTRRGAAVAGAIAAVVVLAPLVLGLIGPDYFLARNLIPAWIPLATVVAAACVIPRGRVLGTGLAALVVAVFIGATVHIQATPALQRAPWRDVARAIGPATVPRVILAAGGDSANALKIYLPHVNWVQPRNRRLVIREVDVVGTRARLVLVSDGPSPSESSPEARTETGGPPTAVGVAVPRFKPPRGVTELGRTRVHVWIVARFRLRHPWRIDLNQLTARASLFFRRAPRWILAFVQYPGR